MRGPEKNSCKEFDNEKKFLQLENSPPPPHNFSNGPSLSNRTGTSADDGARKSSNWLDQWQSPNWAPEVAFSPFRALSRRQLTFPVCC